MGQTPPPSIRGNQISRDRDLAGRARSARPRDGLGRPLPYGSAGVEVPLTADGEDQSDPFLRTPAQTLQLAQRLLDEQKPFHAHEVLEEAWKASPADEAEFWRGLAQLAVGLTHAARGNRAGAVALLNRGVTTLAPYSGALPYGVDVSAVSTWSIELADDLAAAVAGSAELQDLIGRARLTLSRRVEDR
ncbi:DUF309 domain-containing protein [Jatrophihabitans sp. DSM 45814]